jgi:hypothetical protein
MLSVSQEKTRQLVAKLQKQRRSVMGCNSQKLCPRATQAVSNSFFVSRTLKASWPMYVGPGYLLHNLDNFSVTQLLYL